MNENLQIDSLDKKILQLITKNARIPFLEVARECNVSGAAIHQRIQKLVNIGIISGSEFILDPIKLGYNTCAFIGIFLEKANLYHEVVKELGTILEIVECHYTTGNYAIFIKILAKTNEHLRTLIADRIQSIHGVSSTETFISLEERIKRQVPIL